MYCPKCGKKNPEDARFCMHCGADLSEYKMEISPKVEISPKISVSAKAEGGVALKWKKKPEKYVGIEGYGRLPFYEDFVTLENKPFCPLCGNYDCLEVEKIVKKIESGLYLYSCLACSKHLCSYKLAKKVENLTDRESELLYQAALRGI